MRWARRLRAPAPALLALLALLALARGASGALQPVLKLDATGSALRLANYTERAPPVALTAGLTLTAAGSPCVTAVVRTQRRARRAGARAART